MGWRDTLKEKARDHTVTVLFGLIVLLLLIIWRAVPSSIWDTVSEAVPKRVLWALIALELIAIGLLTASAIDNWRKQKSASAALVPEPPAHYKRFGVMWDSDANPLCPACLTLLHVWDQFHVEGRLHEQLMCPKCHQQYSLRFDSGEYIFLASAKPQIEKLIAERK
jgi:hypothetical protein